MIKRPGANNSAGFREMTKPIFRFLGKVVGKITSREETERPPQNRLGRSHAPACPRNRSPLETWLGRSNRSRGLAGAWTTRTQARGVRADPTVGRKPKACQ